MREAIRSLRDESLPLSIKRNIFIHICCCLVGFLMARTVVYDDYLPFGVGFAAAPRREYTVSALIGVIIGSIFTANGVPSMRYVGGAIMAVIAKWVLSGLIHTEKIGVISAAAAAFGSLTGGLIALTAASSVGDDLVRMLCETLLGSAVAYFIAISIPLLNSGKTLSRLSTEQLCACAVSISAALMSLTAFDIFSFSPARMAALFIIFVAARFGRESYGVICGVVFGFAMSISYTSYYLIGAYALAGLFGGIFSRTGTIGCLLAALAAQGAAMTAFYKDANILIILLEGVVAAAVLLCLPKAAVSMFVNLFSPSPALARVDGLRRSMVMRLQFASDALTDVSETVEEVAAKLNKKDAPNINEVFLQTELSACSKCGLRMHCYGSSKAGTYESFLRMTRLMNKKGRLQPDDYPEKWFNRCLNPDVVASCLYDHYMHYESRRNANNRITQIRSVVSDQMNGLSDMLYDLSRELCEAEVFDTETASRVDSVMRSMGIEATDVCCKIDRNRRMSVEISAAPVKDRTVSKLEIVKKLNRVCDRKFDIPTIVNSRTKLLITLTEKANYRLEVGVAQLPCGNNRICGDAYNYFNDGKGGVVMVLSDGMGSGGRAAVDSSMVSGLLKRLIRAGFGFECSLKLINSAMMFKSSDESAATVDITAFDLFSGNTVFYKAGTPQTVIVKGKKIGRASCESYPAGILRDVKFDKSQTVCEKGDIIVMVSDGVTDADGEWLDSLLQNIKGLPAQQIAENIAQSASRRRSDGHEDDITVMVGIVQNDI